MVTVSTKFFGKKNGKDQNSVSCTKKITYFWFPQRTIIFLGGCAGKMEFPEGRRGPFCEPILETPDGRGVTDNKPFRGGIVVFWNYKIIGNYCRNTKLHYQMTFLLSFPKLPLVESQRREVEVVLRTIYLFLILEGLLAGYPYSLVLFQNCPMFPCSLVPTRFHNLLSFF